MYRQPLQLEMFPTTVRLIRCVPERNQNRFYQMVATPTLFGDWTLIREWGRRGCSGQMRRDLHRTAGEAVSALIALQRQKLRRGYEPCWA